MYYAGVDEGERKHYLSIVEQDPKTLRFKQRFGSVLPGGAQGLARVREVLDRFRDPMTGFAPPVALESERGLLAQSLVHAGYQVYFVPPRKTLHYREVLQKGRDKSDSKDAFALACAHVIAAPVGGLRQVRQRTEVETQLSVLSHRQRAALAQAKRAANQARSELRKYWPAAADKYKVAGFREKRWWTATLLAYPNPEDFIAATVDELRAVVGQSRKRGTEACLQKVILPLQEQTEILLLSDLNTAHASALRSSLEVLIKTEETLAAENKRLCEAFEAYPWKDELLSLPGVGVTTAIRIAAGLGEDVSVFDGPQAVALYAGFQPEFRGSGDYRAVRRRRNANPLLHAAIRDWAAQLVINRYRGEVESEVPHVLSPGAWWVHQHHFVHYKEKAARSGDLHLKAVKEAAAYNHALRQVGQRLCYGLYYCFFPRSGAAWEPFDEQRTFQAAYEEMNKVATANATRSVNQQRPIPVQALNAEEAAAQQRAARAAAAAQRRAVGQAALAHQEAARIAHTDQAQMADDEPDGPAAKPAHAEDAA